MQEFKRKCVRIVRYMDDKVRINEVFLYTQ